MFDFLQNPVFCALFVAALIAAALIVIDVNYRYFMKYVLDFVFAVPAAVILSPALAAGAVISKRREGKVFEKTACLGAKGKIIYVHAFAGARGVLRSLPRILDVLSGRLSFVGTKLLEVSDGAFLDDAAMARFATRPGLVSHLAAGGDETLTYEEMFALDAQYAAKRELFRDLFIVLKSFVYAVRGEGRSYMGEARCGGYGEALMARGAVTEEDMERARAYAEEAIAEHEKAVVFKRQRFSRR